MTNLQSNTLLDLTRRLDLHVNHAHLLEDSTMDQMVIVWSFVVMEKTLDIMNVMMETMMMEMGAVVSAKLKRVGCALEVPYLKQIAVRRSRIILRE